MKDHKYCLQETLNLALENIETGIGGPFGALIVKDGQVVGKGTNQVTLINDPTAHAEIIAIRDACARLGSFQLDGCTVYSSCEPCPMCLGAIYWARPKAIYFASTRFDAAESGFDDSLIYNEINVSIDKRRITTVHIELDGAKDIFKTWNNKNDKIRY